MKTLTPDQYRKLIGTALQPALDAGTSPPDPTRLFTPESHRLALDPDVTIVRGARGVGKTFWFKALQDERLRKIAAEAYDFGSLKRVEPLAGYGESLTGPHPSPEALRQFVDRRKRPSQIWTAALLFSLGDRRLAELPTWRERVDWMDAHPEDFDGALAAADRDAGRKGVIGLVLFDALETLHYERRHSDELTGGVLQLALYLRTRTKNLRAKVFIRPDMWDSAPRQFPDASKLGANATALTWSPTSLYGLLFHLLGNTGGELGAAFRESTPGWTSSIEGRYEAPGDLIGDSDQQQRVFVRIAGRYMGSNARKGHTYTWLPNHLVDGRGQVSPRSFLKALQKAVEVTRARYATSGTALHYEAIRQGVQEASRVRVEEVTEDIPWVAKAIQPLQGALVPIEQSEVIDRWTKAELSTKLRQDEAQAKGSAVRTGPRSVDDPGGLVEELIELGVMTRRVDGRVDLPDVYRIYFNVGRKGGVPRPRP
jgi:hypothetical protein